MLQKSVLRKLAPSVLADEGYEEVRSRTGQGLLPGSRLIARKAGVEVEIAVKVSAEGTLSFTKRTKTTWRTASAVGLVLAIVPALDASAGIEILALDAKKLVAKFNAAWKALEKAGRGVGFEQPVFVPIDKVTRKNVGHSVGNLTDCEIWRAQLSHDEVKRRTENRSDETFYQRVKREFAEHSGLDISKVEVVFRIKP